MKVKFTLDENDVKKAIAEYVKRERGVDVKSVYLQFVKTDTRDPRERDYFYVEVSE